MQRANPLARLRKHRAVLGRALLVAFAATCGSAFTVPCPVAAAQAAALERHASGPCHDAMAEMHAHVPSAKGAHSHVPPPPVPHCAHCAPTLNAGDGASPACAVAVAASGAPGSDAPPAALLGALHWFPLLPAAWTPAPTKPPHPPPLERTAPAVFASVAINVRHCVFLI